MKDMNTIDGFKSLISSSGGLARSNLYLVSLPQITTSRGETFNGIDLNILCKSTQLPGRQIISQTREIGLEKSHIAYGFMVDDIQLTFHVMNDYKIKRYFEAWQNLAINNGRYEVGYYNDYAKDMNVKQLRKGLSLPVYKNTLDFLDDVPSNIKNRLPDIGPIDLSQGQIDLSLVTKESIVYDCQLVGAFPTSITSIDLSNEPNGLVELTVSISYTNWFSNNVKASGITDILAKFGIF